MGIRDNGSLYVTVDDRSVHTLCEPTVHTLLGKGWELLRGESISCSVEIAVVIACILIG